MVKISPIKERILSFIEYKGITKVDFCKKTGISYQNLKGKSLQSEIGGLQIGEILSVFSEISPEWLLTGKGDMIREVKKQPPNNDDSRPNEPIATPENQSTGIADADMKQKLYDTIFEQCKTISAMQRTIDEQRIAMAESQKTIDKMHDEIDIILGKSHVVIPEEDVESDVVSVQELTN